MDSVLPDYSLPVSCVSHIRNGKPSGACYLNGENTPIINMTTGQLKALINLVESIRAFAEQTLEVKLEVENLIDF